MTGDAPVGRHMKMGCLARLNGVPNVRIPCHRISNLHGGTNVSLLLVLAIALAPQRTPAQRTAVPDRPTEKARVTAPLPAMTADSVVGRPDTRTAALGEEVTRSPRAGGDVRATDVVMAGATVVMAIIAFLQLRAFNAQSETIASQGKVLEGHVDAMNKVAHETSMAVTAHQLQAVRIEEGNVIASHQRIALERQDAMTEVTANSLNDLRIAIGHLENRMHVIQDILRARNQRAA